VKLGAADSQAKFDLAVIGGGPAGAATALQAARSGLRVTVVHAAEPQGDRIGETIAPSARPVLEQLGLMSAFSADRHQPCYANRSVWGSDALEEHHFMRSPYGHGWRLDRKRFDRFLLRSAGEAGAFVHSPAQVTHFESAEEGWILHLAGPRDEETAIRSRWVADATGRASWFARRLGVRRKTDDNLVGSAGFLGPASGGFEDATTLVEAACDGWWYSALLPDRRMVVVYFTDGDLIADNSRLADFWRRLLRQTRYTRVRVEQHGGTLPAVVSTAVASSSCLEQVTGPNWLAVGDAALSYDPLSSSGIVTAMAAGIEVADAIRNAIAGDGFAVERYAARMSNVYERYRNMLAAYYREERRWAGRPFWARRSGNPIVSAA